MKYNSEKTKQLINQFVWFPGVNWLVESYIKKCKVCQANSEKCQFEPLKVSKMPNGPWRQLATDCHGPIASGEYLMVLVDEYSRYPVVKVLKSINTQSFIPVLREVFALFGFLKSSKQIMVLHFKGLNLPGTSKICLS